jgi:hypothetical protein
LVQSDQLSQWKRLMKNLAPFEKKSL